MSSEIFFPIKVKSILVPKISVKKKIYFAHSMSDYVKDHLNQGSAFGPPSPYANFQHDPNAEI